MRQVMRSGQFTITQNKNFEAVINACALIPRADQDGTWITPEMKEAYIALSKLGYAHSIEVWQNGVLTGGLYGVQVGNVFCGESMFSNASNTSKMALAYLCAQSCVLIDCQVYTDHLASMGARMIDRTEYMNILSANAC
jgi:leucyl/phenylalanyl-tRNA--protein transferase